MTNAEKLLNEIKFIMETHKRFAEEINYHMHSVDHTEMEEEGGEPYTLIDAFKDVDDQATENEDRDLIRQCRITLMNVGYYVEINPDEHTVSHGKPYEFKLGGKYYQCVDSMQSWLTE